MYLAGFSVQGFSRQEHWSGLQCPPPGDLPNPEIKLRSPELQMDSLPAEPQGMTKNTGVGGLSLLQQTFPMQESNRSLLHCRQILYQLSYQGSPIEKQRKISELKYDVMKLGFSKLIRLFSYGLSSKSLE